MKRVFLIIYIAAILASSLIAGYSPSVSLYIKSDNTILEDEIWPSLSMGMEASLLSFSVRGWEFSLPISAERVTESLVKDSMVTPEKTRFMAGFETRYSTRHMTFFLSYFTGPTDYTRIRGILWERKAEVGVGWRIDNHVSLCLPFHYIFSPLSPSFGGGVALRIGGDI